MAGKIYLNQIKFHNLINYGGQEGEQIKCSHELIII
jgi:hypothetical protein